MKNILLFVTAILIWGSTWLVIKFQLGVVDPLISIFYRFLLAALILFIYLFLTKTKIKYSLKQHMQMALQGALLFGLNYWLVYLAEQHLTSGLVAIVFSSIVFLNIIFGTLFLKSKIRLLVVMGAIVGFIGISFVFKNEIIGFNLSSQNSIALIIAFIGAISASLGNISSAYNQKKKIPVIQNNAFGMLYGSILMLILAISMNKPIVFDVSIPYILSLLYLSILGSVVAFTCYLTLLGNIGADKAGYTTLVIPVIAIILSTIFEDYRWNLFVLIGIILISLGNILVLRRKRR
ncbi:MAG: EamA family transporter [Calditrichaceae bacterium]